MHHRLRLHEPLEYSNLASCPLFVNLVLCCHSPRCIVTLETGLILSLLSVAYLLISYGHSRATLYHLSLVAVATNRRYEDFHVYSLSSFSFSLGLNLSVLL